jgi:hypothetical protein
MLLPGVNKYQQGLSGFIQDRSSLFSDRFHYPKRDIQANNLSMLWASVGNTMPGECLIALLDPLSSPRWIATFWVFYYLLNAPEALAAVQQEIEQVLHSKVCDDFALCLSLDLPDSLSLSLDLPHSISLILS